MVSSDDGGCRRRPSPKARQLAVLLQLAGDGFGASRASSSMRDIERTSFDEDLLHAQVAVQHHHIGPGARGQAGQVGELQEIGRVRRHPAAASSSGSPTTSTRLRSAVHGQRGAGQRAVRQPHAAQALGDRLAPQPVLAVGMPVAAVESVTQ